MGNLLGQGGFAAVFRVREKALNRDVAVKVVDLGLTPSPSLAERFVREARTIAQLEHPHIVPIYKVGGYRNEVLYIVMRCLDGPSLRQLLEKYKRLSVGDAGRIARQVADALGYAHRNRVVHRDIKPDNILLDTSGHVLVSDFGIAKAAQEASGSNLTTEGMVIGTPQYMSPEQATGERVDARSDIYSLGIVLYQMLAGTTPFDGESAQSILMKQATATAVPIGRLRSDVPPALAAVVDRLLAKDPADRFQTAEEVSRALIEALPAAARDRVRLRASALAIRSLVGIGVAACLLVAAFVAGAIVVSWTVFSGPPRLDAVAPVSDNLAAALRHRGALAPTDVAELAFVPDGRQDSVLLVVGKRRVVVAGPRRSRVYRRDSVAYTFFASWRSGPHFLFVLIPATGRRDTVFTHLSLRAFWTLGRRIERLLPADRRTGFHFEMEARLPGYRPKRRVETP
ncbi:MAG TPA: serine/threonine-protein kinase [Gemmatimonadales bacterium]|nr:serine/threonine-protein kinase [Gemmatimonadales bacterium]